MNKDPTGSHSRLPVAIAGIQPALEARAATAETVG